MAVLPKSAYEFASRAWIVSFGVAMTTRGLVMHAGMDRRSQHEMRRECAATMLKPPSPLIPRTPTGSSPVLIVRPVQASTGAFSTDGGATWTRRLMATGTTVCPPPCCDSNLAWDNFGNLFTLLSPIPPTLRAIVALSTNGGISFTQIASPAAPAGSDQPSIAVGRNIADRRQRRRLGSSLQPGGTMRVRGASVTGLGSVGALHHGGDLRPATPLAASATLPSGRPVKG